MWDRCDSPTWEYERKRSCNKTSSGLSTQVCVHLTSPLPQSLNAVTASSSLEGNQSDNSVTRSGPGRQPRSRREPYMHWCDALMQVLAVLVYLKRMYRRPSGIISIWRLSCVSMEWSRSAGVEEDERMVCRPAKISRQGDKEIGR